MPVAPGIFELAVAAGFMLVLFGLGRLFWMSQKRGSEKAEKAAIELRCGGQIGSVRLSYPFVRVAVYSFGVIVSSQQVLSLPWEGIVRIEYSQRGQFCRFWLGERIVFVQRRLSAPRVVLYGFDLSALRDVIAGAGIGVELR